MKPAVARTRRWLGPGLLALLLALTAAEGLCRLVLGLGTPPLYETDSLLEYRLKPDQHVQRFGNTIDVNRWGMRSDDFGPTKASASERRVLVFGDSVVNGGSVIDQADLATTRLQAGLRQAWAREAVVVGNVSAGSWGPGNWLGFARRYGFLEADVVVLVVNSGDVADNPGFGPLGVEHPTHAPLLALQEAVLRYAPRYLPSFGPQAPAVARPRAPTPEELARGLSDLRAFLQSARAAARTVVVVHHPDREELLTGRYALGHAELAQASAALGLPFVTLREPFAEVGAAIYRDNIHHTETGQRALGDALIKIVIQATQGTGTAPGSGA